MHVEIPAGATVYFSAGSGEQYSVTSIAPPIQNLGNKPRGRSTAAIACFAFLAGAVLVKVPSLVKASTHVLPSVSAVVTPPPSAPSPPAWLMDEKPLKVAPEPQQQQPTNPFGLKP